MRLNKLLQCSDLAKGGSLGASFDANFRQILYLLDSAKPSDATISSSIVQNGIFFDIASLWASAFPAPDSWSYVMLNGQISTEMVGNKNRYCLSMVDLQFPNIKPSYTWFIFVTMDTNSMNAAAPEAWTSEYLSSHCRSIVVGSAGAVGSGADLEISTAPASESTLMEIMLNDLVLNFNGI